MAYLLFLLLAVATPPPDPYEHFVVRQSGSECLLIHDVEGKIELAGMIDYAIRNNYYSIRIQSGEWHLSRPIQLRGLNGPLWIHGDLSDVPPILKIKGPNAVVIQESSNIRITDLQLDGRIDLDETEDIALQGLHFVRSGIDLEGRRCNQPSECTSFNRRVQIEDCLFEDSDAAIHAETMERSRILRNHFIGRGDDTTCESSVGVELDGSNADLDRKLEYGGSKGNMIEENSFEQEFAVGIRIKDSIGNIIRDNDFHNSYRAFELLDGARYNQIVSSYIGYLSQRSPSSQCFSPCGVYAGPGSVGNVLLNNFFEQKFELQFLERNRNNVFLIDEGGSNVVRSDLVPLF